MWTGLFDRMMQHLVKCGDLELIYPDGTHRIYGDGSLPAVQVRLHDPELPKKFVRSPELALGESYMDGTLTIRDDDLHGMLSLGIINFRRPGAHIWWRRPLQRLHSAMRYLHQYNPIGKAQTNVAHHYDLSGELYDLFLDADKQYSCAYFRDPGDTLEQAQINKKAHIAGKLLIEPDMRVLDIGCGWGGMAITLARDCGARVVGVTLSREQHAVATRRARDAGLADRIEFRLQDYREVTETFDRIVSVGMFEHVGVPHYREYFGHVRRMLKPDGVALVHTIGRAGPPGATSPWINKYIFPGGYVPSMSEAMTAIELETLYTDDVEVWRLHYAETLRHWYQRFMNNYDAAKALYDERFCRMWRFYLAAAELSFRVDNQVVFQFQLSRDQQAVPLTRDYLYADDKSSHLRHAAE